MEAIRVSSTLCRHVGNVHERWRIGFANASAVGRKRHLGDYVTGQICGINVIVASFCHRKLD